MGHNFEFNDNSSKFVCTIHVTFLDLLFFYLPKFFKGGLHEKLVISSSTITVLRNHITLQNYNELAGSYYYEGPSAMLPTCAIFSWTSIITILISYEYVLNKQGIFNYNEIKVFQFSELHLLF